MLKRMIIFVLLQVCLGNAGAEFVRHFIYFRKMIHKPNMGIDFSVKRISFSVKCLNEPNTGIDFP